MWSKRIEISPHGMSNIAASFASSRNEVERWKLMNELLQISTEENHQRVQNLKKVQQIKDELLHLMASACVFRSHQFSKYDPYGNMNGTMNKENGQDDTNKGKVELYSCAGSFLGHTPPSNGKRRQSVSDVEKLKHNPDIEECDAYFQRPMSYRHSLPNINHVDVDLARGKEITQEETTGSNENTEIFPQIYPLGCLGKLSIWNQNKEVSKEGSSQKKQRYRQKVEHAKIKDEFLKMYPGNCRTSFTMRNFIEKETSIMIKNSDSILYSKKNKELKFLKKQARLPDIIQRKKTTSAIFREFRGYKAKH